MSWKRSFFEWCIQTGSGWKKLILIHLVRVENRVKPVLNKNQDVKNDTANTIWFRIKWSGKLILDKFQNPMLGIGSYRGLLYGRLLETTDTTAIIVIRLVGGGPSDEISFHPEQIESCFPDWFVGGFDVSNDDSWQLKPWFSGLGVEQLN